MAKIRVKSRYQIFVYKKFAVLPMVFDDWREAVKMKEYYRKKCCMDNDDYILLIGDEDNASLPIDYLEFQNNKKKEDKQYEI